MVDFQNIWQLILAALLIPVVQVEWATIGNPKIGIDKLEYNKTAKSIKFYKKDNEHFEAILVILQNKIINKEESVISFKTDVIATKAVFVKMTVQNNNGAYCIIYWREP